MAQNPRFNNSDMFTNIDSNDYSEIKPDSKSEVLATQGNVINSIKVFWNNLKAKLAYAVTRPNTNDAVGGNYQPVYVNNSGDVIPCSPSVFQTAVNNSTINLPEAFPIYAGQTVCFNVTNGSGDNNGDLKIGNISVYYPTGATVKGSDVIGGSYLFTYISGNGDKWILNNKINVVSSANAGLMTIEEHNKLHGIQEGANAYSLPAATSSGLGGVQLGYTENGQNYKVQKDDNNNLFVNVPWTDTNTHNTAYLRAGDDSSTENKSNINGNVYLKIIDGGEITSKLKIFGEGNTTVTSDSNGNITISSQDAYSPTNISSDNNNPDSKYTIPGAGNNATTEYFLAGNGTWQKGMGERRIEYDSSSSLKIYNDSVWGTLRVKTSDGHSIDCCLVKSDGDCISSSNNILNIENSNNIRLNRAYSIFTKAPNVRPGLIVFTSPSTNDIITTIY